MNKINWKISMLWFWAAYFAVTIIGVGHTVFNGVVLKMETMANLSQTGQQLNTMYDVTAYAKTVPFHPLYNILIWPLFAYLYFRMAKPEKNLWNAACFLGLSWTIITVVFDLFGWVIIRHPWAMTFKEFYVDYQPWITLVYLVIFSSPFFGMVLYKKSSNKNFNGEIK